MLFIVEERDLDDGNQISGDSSLSFSDIFQVKFTTAISRLEKFSAAGNLVRLE